MAIACNIASVCTTMSDYYSCRRLASAHLPCPFFLCTTGEGELADRAALRATALQQLLAALSTSACSSSNFSSSDGAESEYHASISLHIDMSEHMHSIGYQKNGKVRICSFIYLYMLRQWMAEHVPSGKSALGRPH